MNAFEFSVLSGLRAAQLNRGCTPRVERSGKLAVTAQHEIAQRKVVRSADAAATTLPTIAVGDPAGFDASASAVLEMPVAGHQLL